MKLRDLADLALRQLKERGTRTALTVLAVAVGVAVIVALSSMVEGAKESVLSSLQSLGPDTIIVVARGRMPITDADVARIRSMEGVRSVIPLLILKLRVSGFEDSVTVVGASGYDLAQLLGSLRLAEGSTYLDLPAPQALVGHDLAFDESSGEQVVRVGQPLVVFVGKRSMILNVVGVLERYGISIARGVSPDESIFIPMEYLKRVFRGVGYNMLIVKASDTESVSSVSQLLHYAFGARANVIAVEQLISVVSTAMGNLNALLVGVAATSFVAAGLGTLNIMMVSVLERVREIGILKALGMKSRQVMLLYMLQGLLIGCMGSAAGLVIGVALSYALPQTHLIPLPGAKGIRGMSGGISPVLSPSYMVLATAISITVTLLASTYPSWRAAKLSPVEALRYE